MKKLIISTVALIALTFSACKKDNLQPTTNTSATNIEQLNNQTFETENEKNVDPRNKFVATWVGQTNNKGNTWFFEIKIQKASNNRLKIKQTTFYANHVNEVTKVYYANLTGVKKSFYGKKTSASNGVNVTTSIDGAIKNYTGYYRLMYKLSHQYSTNNTETYTVDLFNWDIY